MARRDVWLTLAVLTGVMTAVVLLVLVFGFGVIAEDAQTLVDIIAALVAAPVACLVTIVGLVLMIIFGALAWWTNRRSMEIAENTEGTTNVVIGGDSWFGAKETAEYEEGDSNVEV
jgi:hypothetical protein